MTTCPRCGEEVAYGQEYCLECGFRVARPGPLGFAQHPGRGWVLRALVGLVVAAAGAAAAVAAIGSTDGGVRILTATGGFATTPARGTPPPGAGKKTGIIDWPARESGWTITLASIPQTRGKRAALERAREARRKGLPSVGVLDSSRYASLHPGYFVVFTGVYASEAEATSALRPARAFSRTAAVRPVVP